jgi:hypothetical protein
MLANKHHIKENIKKLNEKREGRKVCRGRGEGCQLDFTMLLPVTAK